MSPAPFRKRLGLAVPALLVAGVAVAFGWSRLRPVPVVVTPVVRGTAVEAVYGTGTVEAENRVLVKAKSSGSVAELIVREGAVVKKGDLLARIDNPTVTWDLKRGQAERSAAAAQAGPSAPQLAALQSQQVALAAERDMARLDVERAEALGTTGATTRAELERARTRLASLDAQIAANGAQQRALRIELSANAARTAAVVSSLEARVSDTEVRAPLDGVVLAKLVEPGEVVAVNQTLFKIGDIDRLVLEVSIDEADVARVSDGRGPASASRAGISLYAFPRTVFAGRVFDLYPDANRDRKAFLAKVRFDEPPVGLRSGMTAEVNVVTAEKGGALLAPAEAVVDGAAWLAAGGRVDRRPVRTGIRDLLRVEILEGLADGDLVVVEGHDRVRPGGRVNASVRQPDKLASTPDTSQAGQTAIR